MCWERFGKVLKKLYSQTRPSVCPSVTNFVKLGSLIFSDIVHDDSWPSYSWIWIWFSLKMLTRIAWDNVYHQIELKPAKKIFGTQIRVKWAYIGPKISFFFATFSCLVY